MKLKVAMKHGDQSISLPPFSLSQVEQKALQKFVDENLSRGWIELSGSPWVSNSFGIPKKTHALENVFPAQNGFVPVTQTFCYVEL